MYKLADNEVENHRKDFFSAECLKVLPLCFFQQHYTVYAYNDFVNNASHESNNYWQVIFQSENFRLN